MNNRIKELKSQALKECLDKSDGLVQGETITLREFHDSVEQRFVELIVRECYQVCKNNLTPLSEYDSDEAFKYNEGVADCAILIKRHFGVE